MTYLCINCKKEFKKLPEITNNECITGYYHYFIKKSAIIPNSKRPWKPKNLPVKKSAS